MMRVTITGADDKVSVADLIRLSKDFPFVEWGILHSHTQEGTARYPSREWRDNFLVAVHDAGLPDDVAGTVVVHTAAHVCGGVAKAWMRGEPAACGFERVQINGYARDSAGNDHRGIAGLVEAGMRRPTNFILQARSADVMANVIRDAAAINAACSAFGTGASVLFDASGGRGIAMSPDDVRAEYHRYYSVRVGYAGGLGPDNVVPVLERMRDLNIIRSWVDMESGVRTNDALDLDKVRAVLERARPFVHSAERAAMWRTRDARYEYDR